MVLDLESIETTINNLERLDCERPDDINLSVLMNQIDYYLESQKKSEKVRAISYHERVLNILQEPVFVIELLGDDAR